MFRTLTQYLFSRNIRDTLKIQFQNKPALSLRSSAFRSHPNGKTGFSQRCSCQGSCKTRVCSCVKNGRECHSGCKCFHGKPCQNDRQGCPYNCKFDGCNFDGKFVVVQTHEKTCTRNPKKRKKRGRVRGTATSKQGKGKEKQEANNVEILL